MAQKIPELTIDEKFEHDLKLHNLFRNGTLDDYLRQQSRDLEENPQPKQLALYLYSLEVYAQRYNGR